LDEFLVLVSYLQAYHGGTMIPNFKKQKEKVYLSTLSHFCVNEINNSHLSAMVHHNIIDSDPSHNKN
jgi:hypothetical protein